MLTLRILKRTPLGSASLDSFEEEFAEVDVEDWWTVEEDQMESTPPSRRVPSTSEWSEAPWDDAQWDESMFGDDGQQPEAPLDEKTELDYWESEP